MSLRKNGFFKILVITGVLLFVVMAYIIIRSTSTLMAVVPNQNITAGTTITSDMLKEITVPTNTPTGYITDMSSLVGQKLRVDVNENQLLYINNVITSWEQLIDGEDIPDNYVITSILVPSERAVGGLITSGDSVDILGIPNSYYNSTDPETMKRYLGDVGTYDSYGAEGINTYWVLANVKILETDSTLAAEENSSISNVTEADESTTAQGSYYIVALSYSDYQKLRLCEEYLDLWLSLVPSQNEENDPLYDQMRQNIVKMMQDAQHQSLEYILYGSEMLEIPLYEIEEETNPGDLTGENIEMPSEQIVEEGSSESSEEATDTGE